MFGRFSSVLSRSCLRVLAAAALSAACTAGCNRTEAPASGRLDLVTRGNAEDLLGCIDDAGPWSGDLAIRRSDGQVTFSISAEELFLGRVLGRELPAGMYWVSWIPNAAALLRAPDEGYVLRYPTLVSVFSGQVTTVNVEWTGDSRACS